MKIVTARAMQRIDKKATQRFGIPAIILMENAAISSAFWVLEMLESAESKVIFFCGQGNNGGDGFACARHSVNRGLQVKVYFAGKAEKLSSAAKINYKILRRQGQAISRPRLSTLKKELESADLIVDALLGIGLKDKVKEPLFSLIKLINDANKTVLSLDIPSGLDATTGEIRGIAVKAKRTVTFGLIKRGLLNPRAKKYIGKLILGNISLPRHLLY